MTGRPSAEDIESIKSPFAANMLESLPPSKPRFLSDMFPHASPDALDLLRRCLKFNPSKRMTAEEALSHPYVAQFHNEVEEPVYPTPPIRIALDDNTKVTSLPAPSPFSLPLPLARCMFPGRQGSEELVVGFAHVGHVTLALSTCQQVERVTWRARGLRGQG